MDNHFNNILNIFKRLDEAANPAQQADIKKPKSEGQIEKTSTGLNHRATDKYGAGDEPFNPVNPGKYARDINHLNKDLTSKLDKGMGVQHSHGNTKDVDEGAQQQGVAEGDFPGYWTGKMSADKAKDKMVGSCESIEQRLRNKYNQYLKEMGTIGATGMSTGGSTGTQDPAAAQQQLNGVKKELDNAKAKKLVPQTTNTQQAAQGLAALQQAGGDMNKVPGNLKQKIAPVINGIAGALGAGAKNPQQTNKVTQGLGMLGGAAATLE
jgi:hypothetical protein